MPEEIFVIVNSCTGDCECADAGCIGHWFSSDKEALDYAKTDADVWFAEHSGDKDDVAPDVFEDDAEVKCVIGTVIHRWAVQRLTKYNPQK